MRILLAIGIYIGLVGYCVTDVLNEPTRDPFGLRRWLWIIIIVAFPYIGAGVWLFMKFRGGGSSRRREPRAPDDDPEYLMWLEQQSRRRRRNQGPDGL